MRTVPKLWICTLAAAVLAADSSAIGTDASPEQYQSIADRNLFGLRPPVAQPLPSNAPPQLPKIILTGITTVLRNKRALMKVLPSGLKPGEVAKELSLILTEGQRESEIEVLQIDEKLGSVKVDNSGTVMTLTFEKDGAKLPAPPAPGSTPGVPGPLPVAGAATNPYLTAITGRKIPGRNQRLPATPPLPGVTGTAAVPAGGVPTPTGLVPAANMQATPAADPETTTEEQAIIQEIQRQINANAQVNPTAPAPNAAPTTPIGSQIPGANLPIPGKQQVLIPQ